MGIRKLGSVSAVNCAPEVAYGPEVRRSCPPRMWLSEASRYRIDADFSHGEDVDVFKGCTFWQKLGNTSCVECKSAVVLSSCVLSTMAYADSFRSIFHVLLYFRR